MHRIFSVMMLLGCLSLACKKEYSQHSDSTEVSSIDVSYDDEAIQKRYSAGQPNEFSEYSFGGFAGMYFGYISAFQISARENIELRFGTLLSQHGVLTNEETIELITPGSREFGSLGAFTSYPEIKPHCAEVSYTDKNAVRWSSTKITETKTDYGIKTTVKIDQPHAEFVIDKIKSIAVSDSLTGYRVTGHFSCKLYEVNADNSKEMKGKFSGVVCNSN